MVVYFDIKNLISLFKSIDDNPRGDAILRILKQQLNILFNFSIESISEELELQLTEFTEGTGRNRAELFIHFSEVDNFPIRPVETVADRNGIFLLENISEKLRSSNQNLIGDVGEEISTLEQLILNTYDESLHEQRSISSDDFSNWNKVSKYIRPFNSMVIIDRYMFTGSSTGGNLGLFEYNLKIILGLFFKNCNCQPRLVFIFQIKTTGPSRDMGPNSKELTTKIVKAIKSMNKNCKKPEIALIYVSNTIDDEHDRNIITNYLRIKGGDTFVYYNSANEIITNSSDLDVYSLGNLQYRSNAEKLKAKLNGIISEVRSSNSDRIVANFEYEGNIIDF